MATTADFIEYVCDQISGTGEIRYRKMFGEYMVYINDKPILIVCDNTVYIKKLDCIADNMENAETGFPYTGAKEHYILEIDNPDFCKEIISLAKPFIPIPAPKKKKTTIKKPLR